MNKPNANETLFIHPVTNEPWLIPLAQTGRYISEKTRAIPIEMSGVSSYPPKETQNDWTRQSHQVLSSYVQSDTTGGGQILEVDEATDGSRFWFSTLATQYPRQISLNKKTSSFAETGTVIPLGDFTYDTFLYAVTNDGLGDPVLRIFNPDTNTSTDVDELAGAPLVTRGITYGGSLGAAARFFIAVTGGYQIYDGSSLGSLITDVEPIAFCTWDQKLYALDADGGVHESTSGDTGTWNLIVQLDASQTPMDLVEFYDRSDEYALHIIARGGIFAIDVGNDRIYRTKIKAPYHPYSGFANAVYNTDLYISYGVGIRKYTSGSIIPTGLDRDFGLPRNLRGHIVSMVDTQDGVVALVAGASSGSVTSSEIVSELDESEVDFPSASPPSVLMLWNEDGWHTLWISDNDSNPTRVCVSNAADAYRMYWGDGNTLRWQELSIGIFNPLTRDDDWTFEQAGYIEYGDLDFAMTGSKKLLDSVEIRCRDVTSTETITVKYAIDGADTWTTLGVVNVQPGFSTTRLPLGINGTFPDSTIPRYDGIAADSIRIRLDLARNPDDDTRSPLVESVGVVFQKLMSTLKGYVFVSKGDIEAYNGKTLAEIQDFLLEMVGIGLKVPWWHRNEWKSVRFAGISGYDLSGVEIGGVREVSLLEVTDDFIE